MVGRGQIYVIVCVCFIVGTTTTNLGDTFVRMVALTLIDPAVLFATGQADTWVPPLQFVSGIQLHTAMQSANTSRLPERPTLTIPTPLTVACGNGAHPRKLKCARGQFATDLEEWL